MNRKDAIYLINRLEPAIIEAQHKLATVANKYYVNRLKRELIERIVDEEESET